jgi:hypothetical protein
MHQAKQASAASRQKLSRMFERLSQLIVEFESYLMRNILPLVHAGYPIRTRLKLRAVPTGSKPVLGQPRLDIPGPQSHRE